MKIISYFLLFFLLLSHVVVADDETKAEKILKSSVSKVFTVMLDEEMTMDQKKSKVIEITNTVFGYPLMAKLSIGKAHWSEFNAKQRIEFTNLFTEQFQDFYIDKLDLFSDEEVIFKPATVVKKKKVQVPTVLLSKGKEYSILYKMSNTKAGWKIYDIVIEGVSLIHTYRSQYNHILKNGEVEDLLTKMREKKKVNKEL
ncbi:MAG: MlaC/ttg2D family ABC transporter substrate-binding protein [Planctomycetota bacterium]|jgi:phospholipid transport system substrate-binding protein